MSIMSNPNFWYLISFCIFAALAYRLYIKLLLPVINKKIEDIKANLQHSEAELNQSKQQLIDMRHKHSQQILISQNIIKETEKSLKNTQSEHEEKMKQLAINKKQEIAIKKIQLRGEMSQRIRNEIIQKIRQYAIIKLQKQANDVYQNTSEDELEKIFNT